MPENIDDESLPREQTSNFRTTTPVLENVVITGPVRRCNGAGECCDSPGRWDNMRGR